MNKLSRHLKPFRIPLALLMAACCGSCSSLYTLNPAHNQSVPPPLSDDRPASTYNPNQTAQGAPLSDGSSASVNEPNSAAQSQGVPPFSDGRTTYSYKPITAGPLNRASKVLMIGDSLTVGPFGDQIEAWLLQNLGPNRVAVYAACGSSPEHWLSSHKNFISSCGYRETTTQRHILEEYQHGHRPAPVSTPKIETLMARYRPQIVIVQLGTNHYDSLLKDGKNSLPQLAAIYEAFANAVYSPGGSTRMVIWITPPDSSKFPKWVEDEVDHLITSTNQRYGFYTFLSRRYTHYVAGKTGSDGVHYNDAAAASWAAPVIRMLDTTFTRHRVKN